MDTVLVHSLAEAGIHVQLKYCTWTELDSLINRFLITIPAPERMEALRGIIRHVSDQLPVMGIAYVVEGWLYTTKLQNYSGPVNTRNGHLWDIASG